LTETIVQYTANIQSMQHSTKQLSAEIH